MPLPEIKTVCVQWPRFGPYHLARLRAAHTYLAGHGVELVGLETAGTDATYDWRVEQGATPFRRVQVFPDRVFDTLSPAEMHAGVIRALDRINPDAVAIHSYSFPDARACLYWCRSNRRIAVMMNDSKEDDVPRSRPRERLKSLLVQQYDAALLAGTPHRAYFEKLGVPPEAIFYGYDVVDNDYFARESSRMRTDRHALRHLPGLDDDTPYFLSVGRFVGVKNLDGLLQAYREYRRSTPEPWRLILVGDGPRRPQLERYVQDENLDGVVFAGFRQIEDLPAYYGNAGALILPSHKDTWGLVVNEAMAAGLPVLVSRKAGCYADLVREGENGFTFHPGDADTLTALMRRVSSLPPSERDRMGERSREIITAWPLDLFARSLWDAVRIGARHADRPFNPVLRTTLRGLTVATRSITALHTARD